MWSLVKWCAQRHKVKQRRRKGVAKEFFFFNETFFLFLFLTPEPCRRQFLSACLPWGTEKRVWRIPFIFGSNRREENLSGISGVKQVIHQVIPRHIFFSSFLLIFVWTGFSIVVRTSVSSLIPRYAKGNRRTLRSCATVRNNAQRRKKKKSVSSLVVVTNGCDGAHFLFLFRYFFSDEWVFTTLEKKFFFLFCIVVVW